MGISGKQGDNVRLAVIAVVVAVFALSLGDAVIKLVSADFPLWQIYVLRSLLAAPVLIAVIGLRGRATSWIPHAPAWAGLRSLLLAAMWVAYYSALPNIQLSVAAAAYYTSPLFITLFSALFTGERVKPAGWFAIALGFVGVLVVLRPDAGAFNAYALLPVAAAILYALAMILTRTKCRHENPMILSLALNLAFIAVGAIASTAILLWAPTPAQIDINPFLLGRWTAMGATEWFAAGVLACVILVGSIGAAIAYQAGPSSTVATFDYSYLAFSVAWGLLFFSEMPDAVTVAGMLCIVVAGLIAIRR